MRRGARVLVLLAVLVVGVGLLTTRAAVYEATATVTATDGSAAGRVLARVDAPGFRDEVAGALAADPASAVPAPSAEQDGDTVRVVVRDTDPARAADTADTAALLLSRGATADDVTDSRPSELPQDPVNRSSLLWFGVAALGLTALGAAGSRVVTVVRR